MRTTYILSGVVPNDFAKASEVPIGPPIPFINTMIDPVGKLNAETTNSETQPTIGAGRMRGLLSFYPIDSIGIDGEDIVWIFLKLLEFDSKYVQYQRIMASN